MSEERVRTGWLLFYKKHFFRSKWTRCFAVLYNDSTLEWYEKENSKNPIDSVSLNELVPYICVGYLSNNIIEIRPNLPANVSIDNLVGIKANAHPAQTHVHWFLFSCKQELDDWFKDITKTIEESVEGSVDKNEIIAYGSAYKNSMFCAKASMKKRFSLKRKPPVEKIEVDEDGELYISRAGEKASCDSGIAGVMEECENAVKSS
ncbi:hypothetical protein L596_013490 [Steinernema carpocapsae]|uniref:PH domain-containing protein n=1 Tax=Steinernema carpocapsae TaxID=34508 RepID=A0A4U5P0B1_STECR|nr:hypothetical protein L596_013490 [Steinernema carpocapsae]